MPLSDAVVLLGVLLGTPMLVVRLVRRGARGRGLFAAGWLSFFGLALSLMMAAHCVEVIANTVRGGTNMAGGEWRYDFRVYSLLLMGLLLLAQGVRALRLAPGLGRRDVAARASAVRVTLIVLALCVPLIPLHAFFGILVSVLAALTLLVVALLAPAGAAAPGTPAEYAATELAG